MTIGATTFVALGVLSGGAGPPALAQSQDPPVLVQATGKLEGDRLDVRVTLSNPSNVPLRLLGRSIVQCISWQKADELVPIVCTQDGTAVYDSPLSECVVTDVPTIPAHGAMLLDIRTPARDPVGKRVRLDLEVQVGRAFCTHPTVIRKSLSITIG